MDKDLIIPHRDSEGQCANRGSSPVNGPNLEIRQYKSLQDLESLLPAWNELLAQTPSATIFSTWEWLASWWRAYGNDRSLLVLAFFDSSETLVGLAPFYLEAVPVFPGLKLKVLQLLGDGSEDSDNLEILALPGCETDVANGLIKFVSHQGNQDLCVFNTLPLNSPVGNELVKLLEERGWVHIVSQTRSSTITLPASWDAYLGQISSKERGKIRYYSKRLGKRYQVRFYKCVLEEELAGCLESLFELHQKRWQIRGEPGSFGSESRRLFYNEMTRAFLMRQWLEFWLLELDGKRVAADFNFRYRDTVYALQSGFDPAFMDDSVGYVLKAHILEDLIAAGVSRYDFLGGLDANKERWSAQPGAYCNLSFAAPFSRGSLYLRFMRSTSNGKEWLRAHLPASVWNSIKTLVK